MKRREDKATASLTPLLTRRQQAWQGALALAWLGALAYFWSWWLSPEHDIGLALYLLNTIVLGWLTLAPLYFVPLFLLARAATGPVTLPAGSRVAMVVTKAPSEPFWVVERTLRAMLAQDYPHDTWLADEDPAPETLRWCAEHGVNVSTRRGAADYHRATWPRRTRCKEGNLAYFYDHYGYAQYDFVVQMDADHVPTPGYLREMLRPFSDPKVGYVSAPSINDRNRHESWAARGRLYSEALLHGLQQAAYSAGCAPLCIGSHYAVRTAALREIGGLGPELAEDHSTTLMMNAHGWRGVHAIHAIAHGDGPATFADLIVQEFQWCRSLTTILLQHTPRYIRRLPWHLKIQFVACQLWYPFFSGVMLLMYLMPIVALALGRQLADVTLIDYYLHILAVEACLFLLSVCWYRSGLCRPVDAKLVSWESLLFLFARWPWLIAAIIMAIRDRVTGQFVDFRITPKGRTAVAGLSPVLLAPYAALSAISGSTLVLLSDVGAARGFYLFALFNCAIYAALLLVVLIRHARENGLPLAATPRLAATAWALSIPLVGLAVTGATIRGPEALDGVAWGWDGATVTRTTFSASGAGRGGDRIRSVRIAFPWRDGG